MKNLFLLLFLSIMISSCATLHSGYLTGVAPPIENNFKYVGNVMGKAQATYVLGIGGLLTEGLVREAKNNLIENNPIQDGQTLVNFTVDTETSYYLGIILTQRVIVSADILQYEKKQ